MASMPIVSENTFSSRTAKPMALKLDMYVSLVCSKDWIDLNLYLST